jgi:hypothetical protein
MNKEWSNEELTNYVTNFSDEQRESVLKQILETELLQKFINTPDGRLILNSVVERIRDYTMLIVSLSVSGKPIEDIKEAALKINIAYDFMYSIAGMISKGDDHKKNMKHSMGRK